MSKSAADRVIDDPDNHYPYKRKAALDADWPKALVDVSEKVINAQEAYLRDPSSENLEARTEAEQEAQRVSAEQKTARVRYALQQALKDLDAGGMPAHVTMPDSDPGSVGPDAVSLRASIERDLRDLGGDN
jgi:hypothetical protein